MGSYPPKESIIGILNQGKDGYTILAIEEVEQVLSQSSDSTENPRSTAEPSNEAPEAKEAPDPKSTTVRKFKAVYTPNLPDDLLESEWATQFKRENLPASSPRELSTSTDNSASVQEANTSNNHGSNTHVVVSTMSGTGLAPQFYKDAVKPLLAELNIHENQDYNVHFTESATSVTELTTSVFLPQANRGMAQRIILLSGDGGIVDVLNGIMSSRTTPDYKSPVISLLPMGTGNALAHSSLITKDKTFGLGALARGKPQPLPHFQVTFSEGSRLLVDEGRQEETISPGISEVRIQLASCLY
jgi:hypothetical protein